MNEVAEQLGQPSAITALLVLLSIVYAAFLSRKTEYPFVCFLICFWILGQPVVDGFYQIGIPGLPFKLPLNRIMFLVLSGIALYSVASRKMRNNPAHKPKFLIWLWLYIACVLVAMLINRHVIDAKRLVGIPLESMTFAVFLLVCWQHSTQRILNAICVAIIVSASFNAAVALIQLLIDPYFLRVGSMRLAFGGFYRSYGLFPTEYVFGSFQVVAIFVALTYLDRSKWKLPVVGLLAVSIVTTFHRMDILVLIICLGLYFTFYSRKRYGAAYLAIGALSACVLVAGYEVYKSVAGESELVTERLSADTISGRLDQFALVIRNMPNYPLGLGSYDTPAYQNMMIDHGHFQNFLGSDGFWHPRGLGVHNGFLGSGIQYGFIGMVALMGLLYSIWRYFGKRANRMIPLTSVPVLAVIGWAVANMSNGLIIFRSYNVLIIALICGVLVGAYCKGYIEVRKGRVRSRPLAATSQLHE